MYVYWVVCICIRLHECLSDCVLGCMYVHWVVCMYVCWIVCWVAFMCVWLYAFVFDCIYVCQIACWVVCVYCFECMCIWLYACSSDCVYAYLIVCKYILLYVYLSELLLLMYVSLYVCLPVRTIVYLGSWVPMFDRVYVRLFAWLYVYLHVSFTHVLSTFWISWRVFKLFQPLFRTIIVVICCRSMYLIM